MYGSDRTDGFNGSKWWTVYKDGGWGRITFPKGGGNYQLEYKDNKDIVGGKGWSKGSSTRKMNFQISKQEGSCAFIGAYGWVKLNGKIIEYYVNEMKNKGGGGTVGGSNKRKDFSSDGRNYRFLTNNRFGPNAYGGSNVSFKQFISEGKSNVRTGKNYRISIQNHFNHWKRHGGISGGYGSHLYQVLAVENFNRKWGRANITVW